MSIFSTLMKQALLVDLAGESSCYAIQSARFHGADVVERNTHCDGLVLENWRPARAVYQDGKAGPGPGFTCARLNFDGGSYSPLARALPSLIALPLARVSAWIWRLRRTGCVKVNPSRP